MAQRTLNCWLHQVAEMQAELARLMAENADLKTGVWKPAGGEEPVKPSALESRCA